MSRGLARDHAGPGAVQRAAPERTTRSSTSALPKKRQAAIINDLAERYSMTEVAQVLDRLKDAGFYWATRSGVTIAIDDVVVPPNKQAILDGYEAKADQVNRRYQRGALSHQERNDEMVKIWSQASEEVAKAMEDNFPRGQPDPADRAVGRGGQHDPGPAARRYAWSGGQPEGRVHPASDQGQLPRGPVRAGVLHLHARHPQGSGRHRAADRRLRVPDPASGRRVAGRHRPRGRLRHRARRSRCRSREETADGRLIPHRYIRTSVYARTLGGGRRRPGRRARGRPRATTSATRRWTRWWRPASSRSRCAAP